MQILKKKHTLGISALALLSVQTVSADVWNTDYSGTINVSNLTAYKPANLPNNLNQYALNPASLGLAYGNGTGWYGMTGAWNESAGQCVGLVRGLMGKLWTKNGTTFDSRGNGYEMVSIATNTYGVEGKSTTPTAGAMFSYSDATYGHAGVVSHVFQNGDILVVEQNIRGFSGDNNGQKFTYNYRYINKASYTGKWSFYNPAKVGFTMNTNAKAITTQTTTTPEPTTQSTTLPNSGTYKFTSTLHVRSAASKNTQVLANYTAGESVNYDKVVVAEGRQWISYVSGTGVRRYIDVAPAPTSAPKPTTSAPTTKIVSGAYTFKSQSAVKNSTSESSPAVAYYNKGETVYYDRIITENGRTFYSYISSSGARRYVEAK